MCFAMVLCTSETCAIDPSLVQSLVKVDSASHRGISQDDIALRRLNMNTDCCIAKNLKVYMGEGTR